MPNEQLVYDIATNAVTVAIASGGVAAAFGNWVLGRVKETRDEFSLQLSSMENRLGLVCTSVDKINGAVGENTRWRILQTDSAPSAAASLARLEIQIATLNDRVTDELIPLINLALHHCNTGE